MLLCLSVDICIHIRPTHPPKKQKQNMQEGVQRRQKAVTEPCEVLDTVAVTAALNVLLIRHQSLLQSLEDDENLLLPTLQSPPLSNGTNLGLETYADHRESSVFLLLWKVRLQ